MCVLNPSRIYLLALLVLAYPIYCQIPYCLSPPQKSDSYIKHLWITIALHNIDRLLFIIICPILLVFQIVVIIMFARHPLLLQKPGNIFFTLVLIQLGLNLHLISSAIYHFIYATSEMPANFQVACEVLGFFQTLFEINHTSYLFIFLFYIVFLIRYSLKKKTLTFWILLHVSGFFFCLSLTTWFYFQDLIGLNFYGFCGITPLLKTDSSSNWNIIMPVFQIVITLCFLAIGVFSYSYYKKHMPQGQLKIRKREYTKLVFLFVIGFSASWLALSILGIIIQANCQSSTTLENLLILATISNIIRVLQYFFTIFLIVWNDKFRLKLKFMVKSIFVINSSDKNSQNASSLNKNFQMDQVIVNEKLLQIKDRSNQLDLLFVSQIYTIVSGIYAVFYEYFQHNLHQDTKKQVKPINFKESITIQIDRQTIKNYQFQTRIMLKLQILKCSLTFYAPKIFLGMLQADGISNIHESFKIMQNVQKIWNLADGQGGSSGQFFFFSSDQKYVLKTITLEEFIFLKSNLFNFYEHYKNNPNSLLAKVYGLFIIKGDEIQRTYRLILMKNITGCQKNQILRIYDLKGSKYNREVASTQMELNQFQSMTLKDVDFIRFQGKLKINQGSSDHLRSVIKRDAQFLRHLNLIDYSLLVVKVKWQKEPKNPNFWSPLQRIVHQQNRTEYYHMGIIDYLQLWDFQKKSESWWKKLTGKTDISAVNPKCYSIRFLGFIDQITGALNQKLQRALNVYVEQLKSEKFIQKQKQLKNFKKQEYKQEYQNEDELSSN